MFDIFVYGTLKQGHYNHSVMPQGSVLKSRGTFRGTMVDLGAFPGVLDTGEGIVNGEVWTVPDIRGVDALEGNGSFYTREEKKITTEEGEVDAWIYLLPVNEYKNYKTVDGGEWK